MKPSPSADRRRAPLARSLLAGTALVAAGTLAALSPAGAAPLQDPYGTWTAQVENDAVSTLRGTSDQYYTSGLRLGWTSGTDNQPAPIENLNRFFWGEGVKRIALGVQQNLYTPRNTQSRTVIPGDRPYAGVLLGTVNLLNDTDFTRSVAGVQFGVLGSGAGGYQVQNGFHSAIGDTPNLGWRNQLPDQPIFQIQAGRIWRFPLITRYGISADVLPQAFGQAGDFRTYGQGGAIFRIGQGLDSDFGVARITPGMDGTDAYKNTRRFAWYAFGGADGQAVGYDVTLQGSTFRAGEPHVSKVWDVGEFEGGLALLYHGFRLTYTQVWQTAEFKQQKSGLFSFGSLALSAKF
ncbi:MAG: lipid A deacylase LpxR family protein [Gluconacetobacter diazotrophicus]|nr:lipid A deacylase LpxR family protein [Gluconacetobacter diazotrophicus]